MSVNDEDRTALSGYETIILKGIDRSITSPKVQSLWDEIKKQYFASFGSRQAALLWASPISEGEDPTRIWLAIRSVHSQNNAGGENLSDRMLGYAMTMALPESFATIQQNLWLHEPLALQMLLGLYRQNERGGQARPHPLLILSNHGFCKIDCRPRFHLRLRRFTPNASRPKTLIKSTAVSSDKARCNRRWKSTLFADDTATCDLENLSCMASLLSLVWIATLSRLAHPTHHKVED